MPPFNNNCGFENVIARYEAILFKIAVCSLQLQTVFIYINDESFEFNKPLPKARLLYQTLAIKHF